MTASIHSLQRPDAGAPSDATPEPDRNSGVHPMLRGWLNGLCPVPTPDPYVGRTRQIGDHNMNLGER